MPSKSKSPFASSFKSAIKRGTPCFVAVQNIASRCNKKPEAVFNSLFKAGFCNRQKFNGQWIYWACEGTKCNATQTKFCQTQMWQWFVDWCIASGCCTPEQLSKKCSSQKEFMTFCKKFFGKQFTGMNTTGKSKTNSPKAKKSTPKNKKGTPKNFKFPGVKSKSPQRFRKVA